MISYSTSAAQDHLDPGPGGPDGGPDSSNCSYSLDTFSSKIGEKLLGPISEICCFSLFYIIKFWLLDC